VNTVATEDVRRPTDVANRQTTTQVLETLAIESVEDCQAIREEARSHEVWNEA
jgi:hypothetical protein